MLLLTLFSMVELFVLNSTSRSFKKKLASLTARTDNNRKMVLLNKAFIVQNLVCTNKGLFAFYLSIFYDIVTNI